MSDKQPRDEAIKTTARILGDLVRQFMGTTLDESDEAAQLRRELDVLEESMKAVHDYLSRETINLRRRINASAGIHKLPTEILTNVLLLDIQHNYRPQANPRSVRPRRRELAKVCHHWFSVISTSPWLWTDLDPNNEEWKLALKLSRNAPLRVQCIRDDDKAYMQRYYISNFLQAAAVTAARWEAVWIDVALDDDRLGVNLAECFSRPMPALRDIFIRPGWGSSPFSFLAIPGTQPLRHVSVTNASLPWDSPRLSQLKSLELHHLKLATPTFEQLRRILSASPALERLAIRNIDIASAGDEQLEVIHLPGLVSLLVGLVKHNVWTWIIRVLETSPRSLELFGVPADLFNPNNHLLTRLHQLIDPVLRARTKIVLCNEMERELITIRSTHSEPPLFWNRGPWVYEKSSPSLSIRLPTDHPVPEMKHISAFIGESGTVAQVFLYAHGTETDDEDTQVGVPVCPVEVLDALPSLHFIHLNDIQDALTFIAHLSQLRQNNGGEIYNPCPNLSKLDLSRVLGLRREDLHGLSNRVNRIKEISLPLNLLSAPDPIAVDYSVGGAEGGEVGSSGTGNEEEEVMMYFGDEI